MEFNFDEIHMYKAALKALKRRFPDKDGWQITKQDNNLFPGQKPDYTIKRENGTVIDLVIVEAKSCYVKEKDIKQLLDYYNSLKMAKKYNLYDPYLILPKHSKKAKKAEELLKTHPYIKIIILRSFECSI